MCSIQSIAIDRRHPRRWTARIPPWYPVISRTGAILIKIRMCVSADILRLHNLQLSQVGVMATSQEMNKDAIPRICLRWKYQRLTSRLSPCYHTWYLQMSGITNLFQSTKSSCSPPYLLHYYNKVFKKLVLKIWNTAEVDKDFFFPYLEIIESRQPPEVFSKKTIFNSIERNRASKLKMRLSRNESLKYYMSLS